MVVLGYNLRTANAGILWSQGSEPTSEPFEGAVADSYVSSPLPQPCEQPTLPLDMQDPYNVTGTWMRVVCFLDYTELFAYNFNDNAPPPGQPRPPLDTQEATRLIIMRIRVTNIEPPGEDDGQALPVVHFTGDSRSTTLSWDPNATSSIKGTVRLTKEGEVRWTTFSVYYG